MENLRVIVVGASMGGIRFFSKLVQQFSPDWPLAVFIVQHVASVHKSQLDRILSGNTALTVEKAVDGKQIQPGYIYITPTDQHLIVKDGYMKTSFGPSENGSRPSINTLFRSAAVAYRHHAIGILLTGLLSDGTRGLRAINECGGITIVQDPQEAPYPEMPLNAIKGVAIDYVTQVDEMGGIVEALLQHTPATVEQAPAELMKQVEIAESPAFSAPERDEKTLNHGATAVENIAVEHSLWSVLQFMQERTNMLENLVEGERIKGREKMAQNFERKAEESKVHTENLRTHLLTLTDAIANPSD